MTVSLYCSPVTHEPLRATERGLVSGDGTLYPWLPETRGRIPDFVQPTLGLMQKEALAAYDSPSSVDVYRNFLDWLMQSFAQDEPEFRRDLVRRLRLREGQKVLVTGCGLGEDLPLIAAAIGGSGTLYAQDLSKSMVEEAQRRFPSQAPVRPEFSVGDAMSLPFADGVFDAVFHFGGINLFGDMKAAILEMTRVTRVGGRVVFGDEGIGQWLRDTQYGQVAMTNIPLWKSEVPLAHLPFRADDVSCSWVLGGCFYVIEFQVSRAGPSMNIDVPHKGRRGGTARTRYFGQLEGVTPETRARVTEAAARAGMSVHDWLEQALSTAVRGTMSS